MPFIENNARLFRVLGTPFTLIYALVSIVRNKLYDKGLLRSTSFPFPVICVGNLCAGGSGKTPMTEYLTRLLCDRHVGVVSLGFGRKTKQNLLAQNHMTAAQIGDEPKQFLQKFCRLPHGFSLYLAHNRPQGIAELKALKPDCAAVILDDAFQHRPLRAGLNILLTDYHHPYYRDRFLPAGLLREGRSGRKRADAIVVTKCPPQLSLQEKEAITAACKPLPGQPVFFSRIVYENLQAVREVFDTEQVNEVILLTGIAHPEPIKQHLQEKGIALTRHFRFGDHHFYTLNDLQTVAQATRTAMKKNPRLCILTTEKDWARLEGSEALKALSGLAVAVLPIRMEFLFGEGGQFDKIIKSFVNQ